MCWNLTIWFFVNDVVKVVQRGERVKRISNELEFYLLQMGEDGKLIRMQMDEVTSDLGTESHSIFFDYTENPDKRVYSSWNGG